MKMEDVFVETNLKGLISKMECASPAILQAVAHANKEKTLLVLFVLTKMQS